MRGRTRAVLAGSLAAGLLLSGCASFPAQPPPQSWTSQVQLTPQAGPPPQLPDAPGGGSGQSQRQRPSTSIPPPQGCTDFNPLVIGTCLDTVVAVAALPGDGSDPAGLIGERRTGRIMMVHAGSAPTLVTTLQVDGSGDGGLTGLALSPNYGEDGLLFAYVTTATDNRLIRIAPHDSPKPVLTGIPKGPTGNRGALTLDHKGALILATGDAGNAAAATDTGSMAGKVLRVDSSGHAADAAAGLIVAGGLHQPAGACSAADGSVTWVTDRAGEADSLYRVEAGKPLGAAAWTWPDKPGVAGCVATDTAIYVAASTAGNMQVLPLGKEGSFTGKPQVTLADKDGFGRLGGMDLISDQLALCGTVNKDGGTPVSSDDRAFLLPVNGGGGGGGVD